MLERYSHLTDADTRQAMAEIAGVAPPEERRRSKALEPVQCPRCAEINTPGTRYCRQCGLGLTEEAVAEVADMTGKIEALPAFKAELENLARKYGLAI